MQFFYWAVCILRRHINVQYMYKIWAANGNRSVIAAVIFMFSSILIQINIFGHVKEKPRKGEAEP